MTFGKRLRKSRKEKGFTQIELAKILKVSNSSISDWENDKNKPDITTVEFICGALDITPSYLLGVKNEDKPTLSNKDAIWLKKIHLLYPEDQKAVEDIIDRIIATYR